MRFVCDQCQRVLAVDAQRRGQQVTCEQCRQATTVPAARIGPRVVIGDFALDDLLGHGDTGDVYLARRVSVPAPAAVKILRGQLQADSPLVVGLYREAQLAARLTHPNLARTLAVDNEDGYFFSASEYVHGKTLAQLVQERGALPAAEVLDVGRQIATALGFIWEHEQLLYRAVTPRSVMIGDDGVAKLVDFSLAYLLAHLDKQEAGALSIAEYSSPEDVRREEADLRSDLYSLGATLYFALTAHEPHGGEYPDEIGRRILEVPPANPRDHVPDCPEAACRVIAKLLEVDRTRRYQTPAALIRDLAAAAEG